jgi:phenylalanyl-tRNA synthetase alpha chain
MMNDEIPNLTAFDEAELDTAFGTVERMAREAAAAINGSADLEAFRLKWLGRKQGLLKDVSDRWIKLAPPAARKPVGERFKTLKELVEGILE